MDQRKEDILESIIVYYINTAEPIGSRMLSKILKTKISAATIRNVMADLTELGLIEQPHTSAGRIPTNEGYRYYINHLQASKINAAKFTDIPYSSVEIKRASRLEDILLDVTSELSQITNCTSIIMSPKLSASRLKKIQLIQLNSRQLLAVIITQIGMVHNKVIYLRQCPDQETLDTMATILVELFEDKTIAAIRKSLVKTLTEDKNDLEPLPAQAIRLIKKAFDVDSPGDVYIIGRSRLCGYPEFSSQNQLEMIYKMFEDKTALTDTLIMAMEANDGIQVKIGNENPYNGLNQCSVVAGTYGSRNYMLGSIGIVGPTRMNYPKMISAIDYSTQKLSASLGDFLDNS